MVRPNWRAWQAWVILSLLGMTGCQGLWGSRGLPKDPLFVSRRPIEGKAISAAPITLAVAEPAPPPAPLDIANRPAYANRQPRRVPENGIQPDRAVPGTLTNRPGAPP